MYSVGAAFRTEFLDRKFVGLRLLVLGGRVVARLAGFTRKRNQVSHYNTPRKNFLFSEPLRKSGAHDGIRTRDLFLTKEVLYRLSYMGFFSERRSLKFLFITENLERETGLEPATPSLEGSRSTN
jgi:hypothetical protein